MEALGAQSAATMASTAARESLASLSPRGSDRSRASRTAGEPLSRNRAVRWSEKSMGSPRFAYRREYPVRRSSSDSEAQRLNRVGGMHCDSDLLTGRRAARSGTKDRARLGLEAEIRAETRVTVESFASKHRCSELCRWL